jgi:hypothetical protein
MKKLGFMLLVISTLIGCRKNLSVEQTAQQWVEYYYNSEFDKAKNLSTQVTKNMIDTVALELMDEGEIMAFKILEMNCSVEGDSAACFYVYKDEQEEFEEKIHLIKKDKKWLVDEPLAGETLSNEEMEQIFDEYEEFLKEDAENTLENE